MIWLTIHLKKNVILAVDDIAMVQDNANIKKLIMNVELALEVERLLPFRILRKMTVVFERINNKPEFWHRFRVLKEKAR